MEIHYETLSYKKSTKLLESVEDEDCLLMWGLSYVPLMICAGFVLQNTKTWKIPCAVLVPRHLSVWGGGDS